MCCQKIILVLVIISLKGYTQSRNNGFCLCFDSLLNQSPSGGIPPFKMIGKVAFLFSVQTYYQCLNMNPNKTISYYVFSGIEVMFINDWVFGQPVRP